MRAWLVLLLLSLAAPAVAQSPVSPDPTEGLALTDALGRHWTFTAEGVVLRDGAVLNGSSGSAYLWTGGNVFLLASDGNWYRWNEPTNSWCCPSATKPATPTTPVPPPPPLPPVVTPPVVAVVGQTIGIAFGHDGLNTDRYTVSDNGVLLTAQTRDVTALMNGQGVFTLPTYTTPGAHVYVVSAVNAAGASAAAPVTVTVQAAPVVPSWSCTIPAANTKYANGDLKVTLRCPSTFPGVKGNTVTVTK